MSDERPLHVQVAECLGCRPIAPWLDYWCCTCDRDETSRRYPHGTESSGALLRKLAPYDTDIASAFEIIDWVRHGGQQAIINEPAPTNVEFQVTPSGGWFVALVYRNDGVPREDDGFATDRHLPRAICKAFLVQHRKMNQRDAYEYP